MSVQPAKWDVQVFFDGDCPLCVREIRMLQWLDRKGQRIWFTDIAAKTFDASTYGTTYAALMEKIFGRLPDGTWIEGVEVFRRLYGAVGFGPLVWLTRAPGVRTLMDFGYEKFAKNRLRLTGRCKPGDVCALPERAH